MRHSLAGSRSTSATVASASFVARTVEHELEHVALAGYLYEFDDESGSLPADLVEDYDAWWPS